VSLHGLVVQFREMGNKHGGNEITREDFLDGLSLFGLKMTENESIALMRYFDKKHTGYINFEEFLVGLRGSLNERRQEIVDKIWVRFDKDQDDVVNVRELKGADEEFRKFFERYLDVDRDGKVTKREFEEYYLGLSASIDSDEQFEGFLKSAWKVE